MQTPMIRAQNVSKSYGKTVVLRNIDLTVKEGEFTAIMGPSGSGKSTLMNVLSTIDRATGGEVWLQQQSLLSLGKKEQKQRTASARALITNPAVVFADEPTGALDSRSATELLQEHAGMNGRFGTTILMVTHDPYAASYCGRVVFLRDGSIVNELYKGDQSRKSFFDRILEAQSLLGGGRNEPA